METKSLEAWQVDERLGTGDVDLTNCDREPIHIPGAIQPHGMLLVLRGKDFRIVQTSENCNQFLRVDASTLIGSCFSDWFGLAEQEKLEGCLAGEFDRVNPLKFSYGQGKQQTTFDSIIHALDDEHIIVEFEYRQQSGEPVNFFDFYRSVKAPLDRLQRTKGLDELCQILTEDIREICQFDRVMVYRFSDDGSGTVVAESCHGDLDPFLGLHYPASDIPRQAKLLYTRNLLRIIPNVHYAPVPLIPEIAPSLGKPTDLSSSVLRSVSPLHLEYLRNMEVSASMSISLFHQRNLWGLIACHNRTPHKVSYERRSIAEFIGQIAAMEIAAKEEAETLDYRLSLTRRQAQFIQSISQQENLILAMQQVELPSLVGAKGAVLVHDGQTVHFGLTPPEHELAPLLAWLESAMGDESVVYWDGLSQVFEPAQEYREVASGLLALCISKIQEVYLLWFRPEQIQLVNWAGEPKKAITEDEDGNIRISPRQSFERWQDTVRGRSLPWQKCEIDMALELRSNVLGLLLRNADELAMVNRELTRSNDELDSFAYIASHDLKEPLRGIHNYSSFLIEDYEQELDQDGVHKLQTLMRLTKRMESLIDSLLHFSRLGRVELELEPVDLNALIGEVIEILNLSRRSSDVEIQVETVLPRLNCDRVQISELYSNLLSNAIKYSDKEQKQIEVGVLTGQAAKEKLAEKELLEQTESEIVLYVKDNGIGIRDRHLETVFRIFKRLHAQQRYGGGTGAGLTIVKKIVERHGGTIWVESVFGQGSAFYFTLS